MVKLRNAALLAVTAAFSFVASQDNLGLSQGYTAITTTFFNGRLVKSSQTLASLRSGPGGYDFLPFDILPQLAFNGAHHIGDVTLRYRTSKSSPWIGLDSANSRKAVSPLRNLGSSVIAAASLNPTLSESLPLNITREWFKLGNDLAMLINLTNLGTNTVEIGSLGLPLSINNIFTGRTAEKTQDLCSLADPYIGLNAGYVQVTPLKGTGNALTILPLGNTSFEAWRFLSEPQGNYGYQSQTFEGNYEWQIHTSAYVENEWKNAKPWNPPTSKILQPGEIYSVGLRFALARSIQTIEETVTNAGVPLAVGIPGYIIPSDLAASLYLNYSSPVKSIDTGGAFAVTPPSSPTGAYKLNPTESSWGRARVTVTYADGKNQTIHYYITKSTPATLQDLGNFFTTKAFFNDSSDPFSRAPSIMTYDRDLQKIVTQDPRVWISGLSDEGGTGAYLATTLKQLIQPNPHELSIIDSFLHLTLAHTIQQNNTHSVVASTFFHDPSTTFPYDPTLDWTTWSSWSKPRAYTTRRAYNYIHPVAAYWTLYRIARTHPSLPLRAPWKWYLLRAYNTTQHCLSNRAANCSYGLEGLMGETVLHSLLLDLQRENLSTEALALESTMRFRAELWNTQPLPFASEMAWDSTAQEGVYIWSAYFNLSTTATKAVDSVRGYMPSVAHWAWNGNARRYWDFLYAGKERRVERQGHHYGSALNGLVMLGAYERGGNGGGGGGGLYGLRVGYAGSMGAVAGVGREGFASAAFHTWPERLGWDGYSGDYGQGFLGMVLGQCVYVVSDGRFGDVVFGGNVVEGGQQKGLLVVEPRDVVRRRVFVGKMGLKIEIDDGVIERVEVDFEGKRVILAVGDRAVSEALRAERIVVWLSQPGSENLRYKVIGAETERGGWRVSFADGKAKVTIVEA
ncbi:hypothetical protein EJ04DRAFT_494883 [Polyplosphaeria fusca]|uniref:Uncharacterized protein n=1 Tax=Polyplosphaeria fusca TaxID=682080 RepID=A0A9P4V1X8_9PLEO|nr:hypothetical protein EJ04DRAFT_494883 [Polyplosphaeria fusca]